MKRAVPLGLADLFFLNWSPGMFGDMVAKQPELVPRHRAPNSETKPAR